MKTFNAVIDVLLVVVIVAGAYALYHSFFGEKKSTQTRESNTDIGPGAPFKITPAAADSNNTWWQWLSYLFTMPEGYMGHDQVAAALQAMGGNNASPSTPEAPPDYDNPIAGLPDQGGHFAAFAAAQGLS